MDRHGKSTCDMSAQWLAELRPARMFGTLAWWSVTVNQAEVSRRGSTPFRALQKLEVASTLLGLPVDGLVPEKALQPRQLRVLTALSPILVERVNGYLIRRAVPRIQVDHVVARTRTVRRGLDAVSAFSTYCARSVVLPRAAEWTELDLAEADFYGVGVYVAGDRDVKCLAPPAAFPLWPETAASWTFSEALYDRTIRCH